MTMTKENEPIFQLAVNEYGALSQVLMLFEETGELTASLNQMMRGRVSIERVAEEVADVRIMLDQLSFALESLTGKGTTKDEFNEMVNEIYAVKVGQLAEMLCGF